MIREEVDVNDEVNENAATRLHLNKLYTRKRKKCNCQDLENMRLDAQNFSREQTAAAIHDVSIDSQSETLRQRFLAIKKSLGSTRTVRRIRRRKIEPMAAEKFLASARLERTK